MPDSQLSTLEIPTRLPTGGPATARDGWLLGFLLASYLLLISVGPLWFRSPGVMVEGQELSYDRASFLTVNAATLTGFQETIGIDEFNPASLRGPAMVLTLVIAGILFSGIAGGVALSRVLRLPYTAAQIVIGTVVALVLATCAGAAMTVNATHSLFDAVFQSISAFGNCGLSTGHVGSALELRTHLLLLSSVAGGLSIPVLMQIYDWLVGRTNGIGRHARVAIISSAGVYLGGLLLLLALQWPGIGHPWPLWRDAIASSSVTAINTRTAGLHIDLPVVMPHAAQWVIMVLMMIGAAPGGMGGGIKSVTLVEVGRGIYAALRGRPVSRTFGIAMLWVASYLVLILAGLIAINCIEAELPGDRLLYLVISALSNVGLSHDPVSMVGHALRILWIIMLVGRLVPLAILWWLAYRCEPVEIAIG